LMDLPRPRLHGSFQLENAAAAMEAVRLAGFPIDEKIAACAMENVSWPGRLQKIDQGSLLSFLPRKCELWLDGGHNPEAGRMVARFLQQKAAQSGCEIILISGMINTKDSKQYFSALRECAACVYTVPVDMSDAGIDPQDLAGDAIAAGLKAQATHSIQEALVKVSERMCGDKPYLVMICGSLYLVGQALSLNGTPPV